MQVAAVERSSGFTAKVKDYGQLVKMRLTFTVVLSAVLGYLIAAPNGISFPELFALSLGGFLVVGSANGINQIIEKDYDSKMLRTGNRPLATQRMSPAEAGIFCTLIGLAGVFVLGTYLNRLSALLGLISLLSYSFFYTPLKRYSSFAVFVGAFPGAIPPLLGWVAATGRIEMGGLALFALQFLWQFPHFWSIAWILEDDYKRAGYHLLPSREGRNRKTALLTVLYSISLLPVSTLPYVLGISGGVSLAVILAAGILLTFQAMRLYSTCSLGNAKRLMFYSIVYNPLVLLALFIDKL